MNGIDVEKMFVLSPQGYIFLYQKAADSIMASQIENGEFHPTG